MSTEPSISDQQHLDRHLDALQDRLPQRFARWLDRLRKPRARWVRVPAGILMICGGFLGFLPVLGFWMLPLGLLLLAIDIPLLQPPMARMLNWIEHRLRRWNRKPGDAGS
jgi:hypothetical protein